MKYSLRTLLIAAMVAPPVLAGMYFFVKYAVKIGFMSVGLSLALLVMVGRLVLLFVERFQKPR